VAATAAFGVVHSALASRRMKTAARRVAGDRARDAWYRPLYNAQAIATFAALAAYARRLPDRPLYQARGPLVALLRLGQLAGLVYGGAAVRQIGVGRITGATGLAAWMHGRAVVPPEPEAQGPAPDSNGRLRGTGPFAWSRHPLNFAPLPVLWLNPRMTMNLAAFNVAATLYLVAGSRHEEARLADAYGSTYEAYRRSGVPFYLPRVRTHAIQPAPPAEGSARA
jgi:protein-S-isoprenylcysteine O-methyltransferase Ste14